MNETTRENKTGGDDQRCIWMAAGVINYKLCPYNFACGLCAFDKAMKETGRKTQPQMRRVPWTERLRELTGPEKYCRHMLQGLVSYKLCPHNYECGTCTYDQMIQDTVGDAALPRLVEVAGFRVAPSYHFHRKHSWVTVEYGGRCRIGFDDFAAQVLGQDRSFELPRVGQKVRQDEAFMQVRAADREFAVEAPVDGVVTAVNPLQSDPGELEPYSDGWVVFVEPTVKMPGNLKKLYYGEKTMEWMTHSADRLIETLTPGAPLSADGGVISREALDQLPAVRRASLIETVLFGA